MVHIFPYLMSSVNGLFEFAIKPLGKNETAILWLIARNGQPGDTAKPGKWLEVKELRQEFARLFSLGPSEMKNRWYPALAKLREKGWITVEERRTSKVIIGLRGIKYVQKLEDLLEKLVSESLTDIRNQKGFVHALEALINVIETNSKQVRQRR